MKVIIAPSKYVQGENAIGEIATYSKLYGKKILLIADAFVTNLTKENVVKGSIDQDVEISFELFNGECSHNEINRILAVAKNKKSEVIAGVGGGKTLDTAKAVAHHAKIPVIIVPTLASTDAPTSALSVIYTDEGVFDEYLMLPKNPDIVLVDTALIAKAPTRLLVSGMGDALATYYEARVCYNAKATAMSGGKPTMSALALATLCRDTLFENGVAAKLSSDANVSSEAFESVVEANTYLSGIGFESTGIAAAHAIHNGFTAIDDTHHLYHGEKVAFGTIGQLVLENNSAEEIQKVIAFCQTVGLPTTFEDMGIKDNLEEKIKVVSEAACVEGETIHNFPYEVTPQMVFNAIFLADKLGRELKRKAA